MLHNSLLARGTGMAEAVALLSRQFGISRRQACIDMCRKRRRLAMRWLSSRRQVPITLKMPANVVRDVRAYSAISGLTISEIVTRAIATFLLGAYAGMAERGRNRDRYQVRQLLSDEMLGSKL